MSNLGFSKPILSREREKKEERENVKRKKRNIIFRESYNFLLFLILILILISPIFHINMLANTGWRVSCLGWRFWIIRLGKEQES